MSALVLSPLHPGFALVEQVWHRTAAQQGETAEASEGPSSLKFKRKTAKIAMPQEIMVQRTSTEFELCGRFDA